MMSDDSGLSISKPSFEQGEPVTLKQSELQHQTKVVQRIYDPDQCQWMYGLEGIPGFYLASAIERSDEGDESSHRYLNLDDLDEELAADDEVPILDWWEQPGGQEC